MVYSRLINEDLYKTPEIKTFNDYFTKSCIEILRSYENKKPVSELTRKIIGELEFLLPGIKTDINSSKGDLNWVREMDEDLLPILKKQEQEILIKELRHFLR